MTKMIDLSPYGISVKNIVRNASPAELYEYAVKDGGDQITSSGAISTDSATKKGRSPKDKRVVEEAGSQGDVWWGSVNVPFSSDSFASNRKLALDYLNSCDRLFVMPASAERRCCLGWATVWYVADRSLR